VQLPLLPSIINGIVDRHALHHVLAAHYDGEHFVRVCGLDQGEGLTPQGYLAADALAGSNDLEIHVLGNADQPLLVARLDNLGKGASGAAVQNLNIALGLEETLSLV
jgi:N-acetyl-gamma-glutamyl-phosphate reductase